METKLPVVGADASEERASPKGRQVTRAKLTTLEIVSDPGEGAQKCAQIFGSISAKMGNGVWTVEIIPAEIEPPHRSRAGANDCRIDRYHGAAAHGRGHYFLKQKKGAKP